MTGDGSAADGPPDACATCGAPVSGRFCTACGEKRLTERDLQFRSFAAESLEAVASIDSRLFRSLWLLLRRPGLLTREYINGRRRPYLSPLQLFFVCNLIFFLSLSLIGGPSVFTTPLHQHHSQLFYGGVAARLIAGQGDPGSEEFASFSERFDALTPAYANGMVILAVPLYALVIAALLWWRRRPSLQHLVFAVHYFAFLMLWFVLLPAALGLVFFIGGAALSRTLDSGSVVGSLIGLTLVIWLALALRRAYSLPSAAAAALALVATLLTLPVLMIYRMFLFFAVYFAVT